MLTTATTVFGLLPLALSMSVDLINRNINAGGQMVFWGPLSQAIVFGLSFAAILTLVATPALLALPSNLRGRWHGRAARNHMPKSPRVRATDREGECANARQVYFWDHQGSVIALCVTS